MGRKFFKILPVLLLAPFLQSCFLLAAAGLGAGGYYVGEKAGQREEERIKTKALVEVKQEMEQKQKQASAADTNIQNNLNQSLITGSLNQQFAVYPEVRNGVVILHGRVPDQATAERAIQAARKTPGVTRIISNLVILNQSPAAMAPAYPTQYPTQQQLQQQYMMQQQMMQQQIMQQMQAPQPSYPQGTVPAMPAEQLQYTPAMQQQMKGSRSNLQQQYIGGNTIYVSKAPAMQQNQAPPGIVARNITKSEPKAAPSKAKISKHTSSKTLPDNLIELYSEDNDSEYKQYKPSVLNRKAPAVTTEPQKEVVFVPVPVPSYSSDNDNLYRPVGAFNPAPLIANNPSAGMDMHPIIPVADPAQDNDESWMDIDYQ